MLSFRTIIIDLAAIIAANVANVPVTFKPAAATSGNNEILVSIPETVLTTAGGLGSINLPVKSENAIRYNCAIGVNGSLGVFVFDLVAGDPLNLSELFVAGTGDFPQPVYDYIDEKIDEAGIGQPGINNIVEDLTPQLGGNLDLNGFQFKGKADELGFILDGGLL